MNLLTTQGLTESRDPRALELLAKSLYRELRASGLGESEVMALAGELLDLVTGSRAGTTRKAG